MARRIRKKGRKTRRSIVNKKSAEMKPLVKKGEEKLNFDEIFGLTFFGLAFIFGIWGILASMIGFYIFSALSLVLSVLAYFLHLRLAPETRLWTRYLIIAAIIAAASGIVLSLFIQVPV